MKRRKTVDQELALVLIKQNAHAGTFEVVLPKWKGIDNVVIELERQNCVVERDGDHLSIDCRRLAA